MGTTAQKLQAVANSKADIAAAIAEKGGTVPTKLSDYDEAIRNIPQSELDELLMDYDKTFLVFYDIDGNIIRWFSKAEVDAWQSAADMPTPPSRTEDGFTTAEWNWTWEDVVTARTNNTPGFVAPQYARSDIKSVAFIETTDANTTVYANFSGSAKMSVDWGDGSTTETASATGIQHLGPHTYVTPGRYKLLFWPSSTTSGMELGDGVLPFLSSSGIRDIKNVTWEENGIVRELFFGEYKCSPSTGYRGLCGMSKCTRYHYSINTKTSTTIYANIIPETPNGPSYKIMVIPKTITNARGNNQFYFTGIDLRVVAAHPRFPATGFSWYGIRRNNCKHIRFPSINDGSYSTGTSAYYWSASPVMDAFIGTRITQMSQDEFSSCVSLRKVVFKSGATFNGSRTRCFQNAFRLESITGLNLSNETAIGDSCFINCHILFGDLSLPELTTIANCAFNTCTSLKSVVLGKAGTTLTTSGSAIFRYCKSLRSVKVNGHLSSVVQTMFANCDLLRTVDLSGCTSVPTLANTNAFDGCPCLEQIIVPDSLYSTWIAASNWSSTTNNIVNCIVKASEA